MKQLFAFIFVLSISNVLLSQRVDYSIEYETHKVEVFNPEWEVYQTLNPRKFEHITGYFREELAKIIIDGVRNKRVKIYDNRKREINFDTLTNKIIAFEKKRGITLNKNNVWDYIIPYISAYDFEEAVTYNYKTLAIEKKVISYQPYIVHYKSFDENNLDTIQFPLFRIFPKDTLQDNPKHLIDRSIFAISDTVLSVAELKYPVKMPFTSAIFDQVQNKKIPLLHSDGSEFASPKEIDDLFIIKSTASIYNEEKETDSLITVYTDLVPEDIEAIRVAENWAIKKHNLEIMKSVKYFLPLYPYDEKTYIQLGVRISNHKAKEY